MLQSCLTCWPACQQLVAMWVELLLQVVVLLPPVLLGLVMLALMKLLLGLALPVLLLLCLQPLVPPLPCPALLPGHQLPGQELQQAVLGQLQEAGWDGS